MFRYQAGTHDGIAITVYVNTIIILMENGKMDNREKLTT